MVAGNPHIKCREQEDTHHQGCYQTTTAASSTEYRRTGNWLIYSSMMTSVCTETPKRARKPDPGGLRKMLSQPRMVERYDPHTGLPDLWKLCYTESSGVALAVAKSRLRSLSGSECNGLLTSPTDIRLTILQFAPIVLLSAVHHLTRLLDRRPELF